MCRSTLMLVLAMGSALSVISLPTAGQDIKGTLVVGGLSRPVLVVSPPKDYRRIFIVEQHTGRIRIFKEGALLATPFLTVSPLATGGEQGLIGLAFHPDFKTNGKFYVHYNTSGGTSRISEYLVSASDPDVADPGSQRILLSQSQPYNNHNSGQIIFGPNDGYLYVSFGDGGSGGDPQNRAQNPQTLLGKMLRIDVDNQVPGKPYAVPADNPWTITNDPADEVLDEIWAFGLRNPWRWSFDRANGDMLIADVGQGLWEEINYVADGMTGGVNYCWSRKEGTSIYNAGRSCDWGTPVDPIFEYPHSGGPPNGCSITGGHVYRGPSIPSIQGRYFFADYCSNQIHSIEVVGGAATDLQSHASELDPPGATAITSISSFGEDALGELYICDIGGEVFKIEPTTPAPDADGDTIPDVVDNCPDDSNIDQDDFEGDGIGDVCDPDDDNDGVDDDVDNCPVLANASQDDGDGDGVGDACDDCPNTIPNGVIGVDGCSVVIADFDDDGDVDLDDFALIQACFSGIGVPTTPECLPVSIDLDSDVDESDMAVFLNCLSGANIPADPACQP